MSPGKLIAVAIPHACCWLIPSNQTRSSTPPQPTQPSGGVFSMPWPERGGGQNMPWNSRQQPNGAHKRCAWFLRRFRKVEIGRNCGTCSERLNGGRCTHGWRTVRAARVTRSLPMPPCSCHSPLRFRPSRGSLLYQQQKSHD